MTDLPSDRRASPRARFSGTASVMHERSKEPVDFTIRDLSSAGARLVGRVQLLEGEQIRVTLRIDGAEVSSAATVVRSDPQNAQIAIAFAALPPDALVLIERAVAELLEAVRAGSPPAVLVLGDRADPALERDLAQLGRAARPCATLDDARAALADPSIRAEAVILASDDLSLVAQLLAQLALLDPQLRRIVLFGEQLQSLDHASAGRVDAVLRTPVRLRALGRALGIRETDSSLAMLPVTDSDP